MFNKSYIYFTQQDAPQKNKKNSIIIILLCFSKLDYDMTAFYKWPF
jgi:hypothetical protein